MRVFRRRPRELESFFGTLELRVLDALWEAAEPQTVRDLQPRFGGVAYTTLMTTLDRLHRKGVLDRDKAGRAFAYRPRYTREVLRSHLAAEALDAVFGERAAELRPILSFFVDSVTRQDRDALDALERLIAEHRRAARDEEGQ
jgi:predicted transcriptional regulator